MNTNASLSQDEVEILLASAVQAPSMHNTQPWRFEVHGSVIDILLDESRMLPAEDPAGRQTRIGLGAAAFNLRVAAAMLGHESTFAVTPDPAEPSVVARIFLSRYGSPGTELAALYRELGRRHTYRGPLRDLPIPPMVISRLAGAARVEGADLLRLDEDALRQLGGLLRQADQLDLHDEDRRHERSRWIGGPRVNDGVPDAALGPVAAGGPVLVRDLAAGFDLPARKRGTLGGRPVVAVLTTDDEDEAAWVRAGLALQRVLLTATSSVLAVSSLNQALEYRELRRQVRDLVGGRAWPQMILRLGYPAEAETATGRIPWRDTLDRRF